MTRFTKTQWRWIVAAAAVAALVVAGVVVLADRDAPAASDAPSGVGGGVQGTLDDGTRTSSFNDGWTFQLVNAADIVDPTGEFEAAPATDYDDSAWRTLDLPHDWSIELDPTPEGTTADGGYYQGGLGWYRKTFTLPPDLADKDLSLEFDGVYMDSLVYVNGELAARHPYGYTGFAVDLTDKVHTDGRTANVIAVRVQNKLPSSRWYSGSGIYRNTHLVVTDPVHVARWGTYVTTPGLAETVGDGYAEVRAEVEVANESGSPADVTVVTTLLDDDGASIGSAQAELAVEESGTATTEIRVDDPHLWSIEDPSLYRLRTEIVRDGETVDTTVTRFGIRYVDVDPRTGFSLNGEHTKIRGVDLHHDLGALGAAVHADAVERQLRVMQSMGVNALRTAHNPPAPEVVELCDRLGIVVMVEAFDSWRTGKRPFDYGRFFDEWGVRDIQEMVSAHRNSPSVVMWSIGNEIPDSGDLTVGLLIAHQLIEAVEERDATRPITIGSDRYRTVPGDGSAPDEIARLLDGVGLNYNTALSVDALHEKYPDTFFYESESSSATSARGIYQDPHLLNTGEDYTPGRRLTSSYDNNNASWTMSGEYGLKKDRDREFFMGQFLWTGIDYLGEPTPYDVFPVKGGFWGAVDTALFPKDMYYLFQSQWTDEPMVHLLPMNWTDHEPGEEVEVWAYANVEEVELFLNGESLGVRTFDTKTTSFGTEYLETTEPTGDDKNFPSGSYTSPNGSTGKLHLTWTVPFAPGTLEAVARRDGVEVARDRVLTAGSPESVTATPESKVVVGDGRSLAFIELSAVDADGVLVPGADDLLTVDVAGGTLVGLDNGRQESTENYKGTSFSGFNGKALAIVEAPEGPGEITVTVSAPGLEPVTTTVFAVEPGDVPDGDAGPGETTMLAIDPVRVRSEVGAEVELPGTVDVVLTDGSVEAREVTWDAGGIAAADRSGVHTVAGVVAGPHPAGEECCRAAEAAVTVYALDRIEPVSTATTAGIAPALPGEVRLVHDDGVDDVVPVVWDAVELAQYAEPGTLIVEGTIDGRSERASATVEIVAPGPQENIALGTSSASPSADASFSGAAATVPEGMLDGSTSTWWSSMYAKAATALLPEISAAHAEVWVSVDWPSAQTVSGTVRAGFVVDAHLHLPAELTVSYWDGRGHAPVENLEVAWGSGDAPTTITFDAVTTTSLRLDMTSAAPWTDTGFLGISELEVDGMVLP